VHWSGRIAINSIKIETLHWLQVIPVKSQHYATLHNPAAAANASITGWIKLRLSLSAA